VRFVLVLVAGKPEAPADDLLVMAPEQFLDPDTPTLPVGRGQVVGDQLRIGQPFQLDLLVDPRPGSKGCLPENLRTFGRLAPPLLTSADQGSMQTCACWSGRAAS
jgi:hypothetical protein